MDTDTPEPPTSVDRSSPSGPQPQRRATAGRLVRLCLKEMREILRDRRTIITLVLMPLLVYPLLVILLQKLQAYSKGPEGRQHFNVGMASSDHVENCQRLVYFGDQLLQAANPHSEPDSKPEEPEGEQNAENEA